MKFSAIIRQKVFPAVFITALFLLLALYFISPPIWKLSIVRAVGALVFGFLGLIALWPYKKLRWFLPLSAIFSAFFYGSVAPLQAWINSIYIAIFVSPLIAIFWLKSKGLENNTSRGIAAIYILNVFIFSAFSINRYADPAPAKKVVTEIISVERCRAHRRYRGFDRMRCAILDTSQLTGASAAHLRETRFRLTGSIPSQFDKISLKVSPGLLKMPWLRPGEYEIHPHEGQSRNDR